MQCVIECTVPPSPSTRVFGSDEQAQNGSAAQQCTLIEAEGSGADEYDLGDPFVAPHLREGAWRLIKNVEKHFSLQGFLPHLSTAGGALPRYPSEAAPNELGSAIICHVVSAGRGLQFKAMVSLPTLTVVLGLHASIFKVVDEPCCECFTQEEK